MDAKPKPHEDVIQAPFQLREQVFAGDALLASGLLEVRAELVLENAVHPLHLLLLAQLQSVSDDLRLAIPAVLARAGSFVSRWRRTA